VGSSPWPVHPGPIDGEALSSWLRRIGRVYGCSVADLLKYDLGFPEVKTNELDTDPPDELLEAISAATGVPAECIERTTFAGILPSLFGSDEQNFENCSVLWKPEDGLRWNYPELPWFRKRLNACRSCLADYPNTAIMLSWGLLIVLSCPIHRLMLEPVRLKRESANWLKDKAEPAEILLTALDNRTEAALSKGYVNLPGGVISADLWFRLLETILTELLGLQPPNSDQWQWQEMVWEGAQYRPNPGRPFIFNRSCAMLVAIAIDQMKAGCINPKGRQAYLFSNEAVIHGIIWQVFHGIKWQTFHGIICQADNRLRWRQA